jgi:hypothetical protein
MTKANDTYQNTKVSILQGGDILSIDSDGYLDFFSTSVSGEMLKKLLYTNLYKYSVQTSAGRLSTVNLRYGITYIAPSETCSNMSAWLPSCTVGDEILIILKQNPGLESVCSLRISTSGCSIAGNVFRDLSTISLHTSNLSSGWIRFKCFTDNEWSVVDRSSRQTTERVSA